MSEKIASARHVVNLAGNLVLAAACIPGFLYLAVGLTNLPPERPGDPDAGKAEGIYKFGLAVSGVLGVASVVSLRRSSRALKGK